MFERLTDNGVLELPYTAISDKDLIQIVDVSDRSDHPTGTVKKVTYKSLKDALVPYVSLLQTAGNAIEPTIGGALLQRITIDEGSDANHAEIIFTSNAGDGSGDVAIASARLAAADSNADVIKTAILGATADGAVYEFYFANGLTNFYLARKGGASYTEASGATATASQAAKAVWSGTDNVKYLQVLIGSAYVGAGTNKRYRDIIITGFQGV